MDRLNAGQYIKSHIIRLAKNSIRKLIGKRKEKGSFLAASDRHEFYEWDNVRELE